MRLLSPMIRDIVYSDTTAIVKMLQTLREESPEYNYVDNNPAWVEANLETILQRGALFGSISEDTRGFIIGGVCTTWYSTRIEGFEQLLYVIPEARGGMIAVRLIKRFELQVKALGATVLSVGATTGMQEDRTARLYHALGYETKGTSLRKVL